MKELLLSLLCIFAGGVAGGAVHWPGAVALSAPLVSTVIPGATKAFGYSTTQYINALPVGYSPQYAFQIPQPSGISALHSPFYPVPGASYYPASVFYPTIGNVPIVPGAPPASSDPPTAPSAPPASGPPAPPQEQPAGDADTAVIDAADFAPQTQQQSQENPTQPQTVPIPPASTFPSFPTIPQGTFPQIPQLPQGSDPIFPQIPQLPQGSNPIFPQIPQIPQGSLPSLPQFPQIPISPPFGQSSTPSPPSSFPAADGGDKGLNDEDTIAVESA